MAWYECLVFVFIIFHFASSSDFRHKCHRKCVENETPKTCFYKFSIGLSQRKISSEKNDKWKLFLSINGKRPGPTISVCQNDTIVVEVNNRLPGGVETSLHWHGFPLGTFPFMDGVPMITQCPIFSHTRFRYRIRATKSGTFYYRAHSVPQQLDGVYGPLIVNDRTGQIRPEKIVFISVLMKTLQTFENDLEADLKITGLSLKILDNTIDRTNPNDRVLETFRIINAAALDCPVRLFTHTVPFRIVAVDGNNVKPLAVTDVIIYPGERMDILIKSEIAEVIHVVGYNRCKGHSQYNLFGGISEKVELKENNFMIPEKFMTHLEPENLETAEFLEKSHINVYLPFDISVFNNFKEEVDFRYKLGEISSTTPSLLTKPSVSVFQIRNKSFLYPPTPVLSQPHQVPQDVFCDLKGPSSTTLSESRGFHECLQAIKLPHGKIVDLFIIDEGRKGNNSQTFYLHGLSFLILASKSFGRPISGWEIEEQEALGKIEKNTLNPIKKNIVTVPNKGFAVIRLKTDSPEKSKGSSENTMATLFASG